MIARSAPAGSVGVAGQTCKFGTYSPPESSRTGIPQGVAQPVQSWKEGEWGEIASSSRPSSEFMAAPGRLQPLWASRWACLVR